MSLSEEFQDLDPKVAEALTRAVEGLRAEFRQLLAEARGETAEDGAAEAPLPEGGEALSTADLFEPERALEPEMEPVPVLETPSELELGEVRGEEPPAEPEAEIEVSAPAPRPDAIEELKHAVAQLDRAATQGEVLDALLAGARRFSSRSAVFLVRPSVLEGWEASGFEAAGAEVRNLELALAPGSPWQRATAGQGGVPLEAEDCRLLCGAIDAAEPAVGILVPMVLGDRVAAVLYGDRLDGADSLDVSALQLLTFNAGQVLETLPVRNRRETATLKIAAIDIVAKAEAEEIAVVEPEPEPEVAPEAAEPAGEFAEAVIEPVEELVTAEPEAAEPEPELEAAEPEPTGGEMPAVEFEPQDVVDDELVTRTMAAPEPRPEPSPAETTVFETVSTAPGTDLEEWPSPDALEESGVELTTPEVTPPAPEPEPEPEPVSEPEPEPEEPARATAEVRPPSDLEGPGWAFTQRPSSSELGEEALHEEARRLARLLVTEIKLYNEEQVDMGRQQRDLYGRLREDIERSRQIYSDRIDSTIRDKKDYFHEALVRILAGGDAGALGA